MRKQGQSLSDRVYRLLLRVFPFDFRGDFEGEMAEVFREQRSDAQTAGKWRLLRLWWETVAGIFATAPGEHFAILKQDLVFALRMMRRSPGFTAASVVTLALGLCASTAVFIVVNAILLRPLPYPAGDRLVVVRQQAVRAGVPNVAFSVPEIADYRERNHTFSALAEYHCMLFTLFGPGEAERVRSGVVSADFFDLLGVKPALGRTFQPADEKHDAPAVLVLSHEYWQRHGADPSIVGKTVEMNDRVHTVVGVLPQFPQYPDADDVYMPISACPYRSSMAMAENRDSRMMTLVGRLKPGVTLDQARADLASAGERLQHEYPASYARAEGYQAIPARLREELIHEARPTLLILLGSAIFLLLIGFANSANFMLARMSVRGRELAVRNALGAGSGRLLRQFWTESFLMVLLAAGIGLALASLSLKPLVEFAARLTPRASEIRIDASALAFALLAAVVASIALGSVAALSAGKSLAAPKTSRRTRNGLGVCQVVFAYVLLIAAGLMSRSLLKLHQVEPGFVPQHVLTLGIHLNWSKYPTERSARELARRLLDRVRSEPGVTSAAIASSFPLNPDTITRGFMHQRFEIEESARSDRDPAPRSSVRIASPDYFKTLGIPIARGRAFADADGERAPGVAVINESLALHLWNGQDPIGKRISFDHGRIWIGIVGVARDVREFGLNQEAGDELYLPVAQVPAVGSLLVRTSGDPMDAAARVRRAVLDIDPQTAVSNLQTLEQARAGSIQPQMLSANLLVLFALIGLAIAAGGTGAIVAVSVSERMPEIAIRLILGAQRGHVLRMVLGQGMLLVSIGVAVGLVAALVLTRLLAGLLFEVTPTDPLTFAGVSLLLAASAFVSCYLPARRATRVDPLVVVGSS